MSSIDPISKTDDLVFRCGTDLPCFNLCCRGLNQTITGYDILKISRFKNITTQKFLVAYSFSYTGKQTGMPVVSLFEQPEKDNSCIFLDDSGCSVYKARPLACRLYPAARGISKDKRTGKLKEHFAIISEDHCEGFGLGSSMTIAQWIEDQGAQDYIEANDLFMQLVLDLGEKGIKPDKDQKELILTGCYNLDLFLEQIISGSIDNTGMPDLEELKNNELLLFKTGVQWTRDQLLKT
ncbi:MAG: YkgJ family cysteine cluster protein [Thermodesulfobacteriota bacterium]